MKLWKLAFLGLMLGGVFVARPAVSHATSCTTYLAQDSNGQGWRTIICDNGTGMSCSSDGLCERWML